MCRAVWISVAVALAAACGDEEPDIVLPEEALIRAHGEALCDGVTLDNAVDEALCPRILGRGLAPRYADSDALCRRLAIDLNGRLPSWGEVQTRCRGATPAEMVDAFMADPAYVTRAQRRWADNFGYTAVTYFRYVEDLDALVGALYAGDLDYETFAVRALVHPGFTGRYFGEMRVARAFQIFVCRDAHPVEREDLMGLWIMWIPVDAYDEDHHFEHLEIVAYPPYCAPPLDELLCRASLFGDVAVSLPVPRPDSEDPEDNIVPLSALSAADWAVLERPARLIAGLPAFREHAVAEALDRYVGWEASRALPEVVHALVQSFEDSGLDVRALEREILLSNLYLAPNAPPTDEVDPATGEPPRWRYKPLVQLEAEVWMDAIQQVTGASVGWCDHRFPYVLGGVDEETRRLSFHPHGYPLADLDTGAPDLTYRDIAQTLGGCPDRYNDVRFTGTGATHALMQEQFVQRMCHRPEATGLVPGATFGRGWGARDGDHALAALYTHQVRALLSRDPDEAEIAAFVDDVSGCGARAACAPSQIPAQLCEALVTTGEFLYR